MVKVHMMKAYEGDFIWLSYGDSEKEYHLLIDGGIKECRERYADVIRSISAKGESIEAIILTHIDCDHIAGACEGIAKIDAEVLQRTVKKIFFNTSEKIYKEILISKNSGEYGVKEGIEFWEILKEKGISNRIVERIVAGETINLADTFISAHTPTEKYKEWIKGAPELFEEDESFIRSYRALKDKEISLDKVEKEIKELEKELNKIEKSKESVTQLGKLCEEYNTLVKSEDILIFNEKNSNLEIYNNLLNKIAKRIRYIKNEILTMYDSKLMQGEKIRNGDIRDNESLESALKNVEGKKQNYINQREKHAKYGNIEKDIKGIEKKLNELKSEKIPLDTIYEIGEKRVKEQSAIMITEKIFIMRFFREFLQVQDTRCSQIRSMEKEEVVSLSVIR